ncbi:unnamed protein product [Penicillium palitans]
MGARYSIAPISRKGFKSPTSFKPLKHKAHKETVADQRPIPTPDNAESELLTELRVRGTARSMAIRLVVREATWAMAQLDTLLLTSEATNDTNPGILVIRQLEHIMARLMCRLMEIRRERDRDQASERDLWREVTG